MTQLVTYLDDIKEGVQFRSDSYLMSEERIIEFAKQFDPQPFHTDPVAATKSNLQTISCLASIPLQSI